MSAPRWANASSVQIVDNQMIGVNGGRAMPGGGKTLVLQFCSSSGGGQVYTNFWYEWQGQ